GHRPARARDLRRGAARVELRADRGQQPRLDVARDPRPLRRSGGAARRVHPARAAAAAADARSLALQDRLLRRRQPRRDARLARDVRRLLLHLALRPERARLLADEGGRDLPADDDPDHPRRADHREALGPGRLALADGRRHVDPRRLALALPEDRAAHRLLVALAAAAARRHRHGIDDVADDLRRDGLRADRQSGGRLRRPEQLPPGRRLARDRADGCDPALVRASGRVGAGGLATVRRRPPRGAARQCGDCVRSCCGGDRARTDEARGRAGAHRGSGACGMTSATRLPAAERREALIETAIRVFSDGSYRGTTTAEIARAAGISEPILYRHFASKRDLYLAALDHVWGDMRASWERALESTDNVREALETMGRGHVTVRDCKFQMAELWVQALGEAAEDPELRKHLRRHMREVHDFMADVIRRGQAEGVLHAERDADAEAWTFIAGGVLGMVGRRIGLLDEQEVKSIRQARLDWLTS